MRRTKYTNIHRNYKEHGKNKNRFITDYIYSNFNYCLLTLYLSIDSLK